MQQLRLLEELAAMIRQRVGPEPTHSITELRGLGKDVWWDETGQPIDAQEYVNRERESWGG